jgi:hypothetical protein
MSIERAQRITMRSECYGCLYKRDLLGNAHVGCRNPDPAMTGDAHGVAQGWFRYPLDFDPVWKTRLCRNFVPGQFATRRSHLLHRSIDHETR